MKKILELVKELNFIDVGCAGSLPAKWKPLWRLINLIGFDPNKEECEKVVKNSKHKYKTINIYPFAIFDTNGEKTLYKTKSLYCYSLFPPNLEIVNQFYSYKDMFTLVDTEIVKTKTLDECIELENFNADILKIDTQGAGGHIISKSKKILRDVIHVEIEVHFIESYKGQGNSFGEIKKLMEQENFILFDINSNNRMPRDNSFFSHYQNEQIIYAETTWIKDYVSLYKNGTLNSYNLTREKALKIIVICNIQGCYSYGLELAKIFHIKDLIDKDELDYLSDLNNWSLKVQTYTHIIFLKKIIHWILKLLPSSLNFVIGNELRVVEYETFYKQLQNKNNNNS